MTITAPIKSAQSLVEQVCTRLTRQLRKAASSSEGKLPPERLMAEQLGVSRTVLREATKRLEQQGLLEIRHGSGIRMVNHLHKPLNGALNLLVPDENERLVQLTEVRLALEPENARLAAERADAGDLKQLKACHDRFINSTNFATQVRADMEFHRLIAEASGNKIAALLITSLSDLLTASLSHGYRLVTKDQAVADHGKILDAILARNATAAATAMKNHLLHARDDLGLKKTSSRR